MNATLPWSEVGEMRGVDRRLRRPRVTACTEPGCTHIVNEHYSKDEDPLQKCSFPGCPCRGLKRPAVTAEAA